jgi:multidrug efflux pump subunit AcrA (membrane-fusion protein)
MPPSQFEQRATPRSLERGNRAAASAGLIVACVLLATVAVYLAARVHSQSTALSETKAQLAQSNSRADAAQAGLDAAKAQSSDLQAKLASGAGEKSDLQSQLDRAKALAAGLQAQLNRDQSQQADLQVQLAQAKALASGRQTQFDRLSQESASLRAQLDQVRSQGAETQAQLAKAQADLTRVHPLVVESRQLHLSTAFEKSFWDQRFTLHISNTGTDALNLRITISGPDKTRAQMAVLEGGASLNIERLPAGENVVIASDGFEPLNLVAR